MKLGKSIVAALVAGFICTGCAPIDPDELMGRTVSTPTTEPKKLLDCDLIFPAPAQDTLKP
jgi:hypothetical protein